MHHVSYEFAPAFEETTAEGNFKFRVAFLVLANFHAIWLSTICFGIGSRVCIHQRGELPRIAITKLNRYTALRNPSDPCTDVTLMPDAMQHNGKQNHQVFTVSNQILVRLMFTQTFLRESQEHPFP